MLWRNINHDASQTQAPFSTVMIRRLELDDLHRVSALIRNSLLISTSADYDLEQIGSLAASYSESRLEALATRGLMRVHESAGRVDGVVCLQGERIQALFVSPDRLKRGVGAELIGWAERAAKERGKVCLRVAASLTAVGFYKRMGFIPQRPGRAVGGARVVHMIKAL